MAASTTVTAERDEHEVGKHHPTATFYVQVAVVLAVLTALEFSTYFIEFGSLSIPLLLVLMSIKFALIVGFFMHLKFDTDTYSKLMLLGLMGALLLFGVAFLALREVPTLPV